MNLDTGDIENKINKANSIWFSVPEHLKKRKRLNTFKGEFLSFYLTPKGKAL